MPGIVEPDSLGGLNATMIGLTFAILCHTQRVWQTGVYKESGKFKPDEVWGQPEPKPTWYSPGRQHHLKR